MDMTTLLLYIVAVAAVTITPGPTMLLALNNGATKGKRVAACGIAGAALSDLLLIGAVGCGLGAILQASELLFTLVKWAGAAYLFYVACQLWRAPLGTPQAAQNAMPGARNGRAAFMRSLLVALSNPKGLLFFSAFLPQFIQPAGDVALQYVILALVTALIDIALMSLYALGGHHAMRIFSGRALRWLNRTCAGLLAGLAIALSFYRRNASS
ncbi:LysE family translocator [Serratia marcescens]|uniref:LysE family translocator n=1 Tax=Serratia TaxID=613 RepID=UPI0005379EFB|nr:MULTISPECIES: LysE family translocator [Serratia]EMB2349401.1 LysE family translocator [Serratia marcescens]EMD1301773.1 LysE family translocator [Serratia marcescens]MBH2641815.1 LysE family translocator [Serratia ureilytica]MBJ2097953.1 LysE family translocator [Serratia ureilytica]MBN5226802.1 LysE family translocator [Serratia ureilytica]